MVTASPAIRWLWGADLLAVLHAGVALPRPLQDRFQRRRAGARDAAGAAAGPAVAESTFGKPLHQVRAINFVHIKKDLWTAHA